MWLIFVLSSAAISVVLLVIVMIANSIFNQIRRSNRKLEAEGAAEVKRIAVEAQADANRAISSSITPELIQMKEAEARLKHGWVTVNGAGTVVKTE